MKTLLFAALLVAAPLSSFAAGKDAFPTCVFSMTDHKNNYSSKTEIDEENYDFGENLATTLSASHVYFAEVKMGRIYSGDHTITEMKIYQYDDFNRDAVLGTTKESSLKVEDKKSNVTVELVCK